jgi:hypothetical protein
MFSNKLKRPLLALAVTAGSLAVAGPASAQIGPATMGNATASIVVYDYEGTAVQQVPKGRSIWAPGDGSGDVAGPTGLKFETEITDYVRLSTASDVDTPRMGAKWELSEYDAITSGANRLVTDYTDDAAVDKDLYQPDMGIREQPTQVKSILVDLPPLAAKVPQARSAVPPELDANANTSLPEVDDEVLASINYEPDYIEGTQFVD